MNESYYGRLEDRKMFGKRISSLLLLVFVFPTFTWADTIYVKSGSGGDGSSWAAAYGNLHTALDDAEPNDSIWVAAGTFSTGGTPFKMKNGVGIYGGFPDTGDPNLSDRDPSAWESILRGNDGRIFHNNNLDPNAILDGFTITGGRADDGGGMYNINSDPTIINCNFVDNGTYDGEDGKDARYYNPYCNTPYCPPIELLEPATDGGSAGSGAGMYNSNSSPTIINCTFKGNRTGSGGRGGNDFGAGYFYDTDPCSGGSAGSGGGMYNRFSEPTLINCLFLDNLTGSGGAAGEGLLPTNGGNGGNGAAMFNDISSPTLINCTFNGNKTGRGGFSYFDLHGSDGIGGGMYDSNSSPLVTNCIFWGNFGGEIYDSNSSPIVTYSDVQGGYPGIGNIDSQPFSVCSTVRLSPGSACIDAADNTAIPGYILTDLEDSPRFIDDPGTTDTGNGTPPIVDMGAYEYDPMGQSAPYAGSGTAADPYQIWSGAEFSAIRCNSLDWDKHFRLMNDIDLSEYKGHPIYNIIGYEVPGDNRPFTGVFDGAGHTISGFEYYDYGGPIGLFGKVEGGEIKNLGLIEPNMVSPTQDYAGLLVGRIIEGRISGCYVQSGNVHGKNGVGGLIGNDWGCDITDCYSMADVTGERSVGGLVGLAARFGGTATSTITNCYSGGSVDGNSSVGGLVGGAGYDVTTRECYSQANVTGIENVGGLYGYNNGDLITDCYSTGSVVGETRVGGFVGLKHNPTIDRCYSVGSVTGNENVGGFAGQNWGSVITDCYWDTETSGQPTSAGGMGLPTAHMKTRSTFTNTGWDFIGETINGPNDIWRLCDDLTSYPRLAWEFPSLVDFVCPDGVDFFDYSFFAGYWAEDNCGSSNNCGGTDLDLLGTVDIYDLRIFADNWLEHRPPGPASNPNPMDGTIIGNLDADLSWSAGLYATSHDVYFGTDNPPPFIQNQFTTTFDPGTMASNTNYYWRIDSVNSWGKTSGLIWRFSTLLPPPPP